MDRRGHLQSTFRGSTFPSVKSEHLNNYWLPAPPPTEQEEIATSLDRDLQSFTESICVLDRTVTAIREWQSRQITDLVTGKVDVRVVVAHLHLQEEPQSVD